jgi:hypothetical protein
VGKEVLLHSDPDQLDRAAPLLAYWEFADLFDDRV